MDKRSHQILVSTLEQAVEQVGKVLASDPPDGQTELSNWKFIFYDNGGQDVFQTPNALFLTEGCLIVLVFDMHQVQCSELLL